MVGYISGFTNADTDRSPLPEMVLKHVLDTKPDEMPKLHHILQVASTTLVSNYRPLALLDYVYHQIYSDIILNVNDSLKAHEVEPLSPKEDVRLVMSSAMGASLYITGMRYTRFIQVYTVCSQILFDSLIKISNILELKQPVNSTVEPRYDDQTDAIRLARSEGIETDVDSYDLLTLYYVYLSNPSNTIRKRIEDLVLHKRMHAIQSLSSYDGYLRALTRKIRLPTIYHQPVLNNITVEGYRLDKMKPVLSKHTHVITHSQNEAKTLYASITQGEAEYPVTVNSIVKTLAFRWYDYDQYSLRLGLTLQNVGQFTYEVDALTGKLIEKGWRETDIRFCPTLFQVNVLRYLEPRIESIKPLLLSNTFKAFALTSEEVANSISDRLFTATNYKPWLDTQYESDLNILFETAKLLGQTNQASDVKNLMLDLQSKSVDEAAKPFLLTDCPVSTILETVSPCNLRFDFIIVKPEYNLFKDLIAAMLVYHKVSKPALEAITKQFLMQN